MVHEGLHLFKNICIEFGETSIPRNHSLEAFLVNNLTEKLLGNFHGEI